MTSRKKKNEWKNLVLSHRVWRHDVISRRVQINHVFRNRSQYHFNCFLFFWDFSRLSHLESSRRHHIKILFCFFWNFIKFFFSFFSDVLALTIRSNFYHQWFFKKRSMKTLNFREKTLVTKIEEDWQRKWPDGA